MGTRTSRYIAVAAAVVVALTSVAVTPASAHHRWHHGNAAVLGAVLGMFGTVAAVAAADRYRDSYYDYDYYGGPYYYAPYGYYGGSYRYAPRYRYYRGRHYSYRHSYHHRHH